MQEIISVKFREDGRAYSFAPNGVRAVKGDRVIVETAGGLGIGIVCAAAHSVEESTLVAPLKKVVRVADEKDLARVAENHEKEKEALRYCAERVEALHLGMQLVSAEYAFDSGKITIFFMSETRVDFRELVRQLAAHFHARIELRQIGVRDKAKMLGGIGICGQPFCCHRFLNNFQPVSVKMAKEQGLPINPANISGSCGRLMCCLKYEQNAYDYLTKITPPVGATVKTAEGTVGTVIDANAITGNLIVKINGSELPPVKTNRDAVEVLARRRQPKESE